MKYSNYILALMALPMLGACGDLLSFKLASTGVLATTSGIFSQPDVNLKEKNYAAADFLVGQMSSRVGKSSAILVQPLEEMDNAGISSPLGAYIPEGVGLRFSELGYRVWLHQVAANGNSGLYSPPPENSKPAFILKGTYKSNNDNLAVFLRLVNVRSSQVVASFDYELPLSREVRDMSKTQTRIFRVAD